MGVTNKHIQNKIRDVHIQQTRPEAKQATKRGGRLPPLSTLLEVGKQHEYPPGIRETPVRGVSQQGTLTADTRA